MPDIQYLGHSCVRLRGRDGIVMCDPYDRSIGLDLGRPTAHIVTVSHDHAAHNNIAGVKALRERLFVLDGPGEYEVGGILISGVRTYRDKAKGAERGFNTVYVMHLDEIVLCHLGNLAHELSQGQLEAIGTVDVLFVPVGGGEALGPAEASNVISQIEPRIVVPIHYALPQQSFEYELAPLEKFTSELGLKEVVPQEKLSINTNSTPAEQEETRVVILRPTSL